MGIEILVLKGTNGIAEGEIFYIHYGEEVTIGRGHECDISYLKFDRYQQEESKDKGLLSVSRKHLRISFYNTHSVELKDLSSNGSYLNGKLIKKRAFITHIATSETPYEIKLGPTETFLLTADPEGTAGGKDSKRETLSDSEETVIASPSPTPPARDRADRDGKDSKEETLSDPEGTAGGKNSKGETLSEHT